MKKLGFGLMRLPTLGDKVDVELLKKMVDLYLERGFTYFDTAWMYMDEQSERATGEALVKRHPRDSFTLTTKLHASYVNSFEDRDKVFYAQLERTGAGYFDYYFLHGINARSYGKYEKYDCFRWLEDKKRAGLVRHMGFSFHDHEDVLDRILTEHPEMELVQLQINYLDWESENIRSRRCYETAVRHGMAISVMEPVKGGALAKVPPEAERLFKEREPDMSVASWGVRFAASLPNVMVVLSGMSDLSQVDDNTSYMSDFRPLTEEEKEICLKAADIINQDITIACTACSYCTDGCPMGIPIPRLFSVYNESRRSGKGWNATVNNYISIIKSAGDPKDCVECGQCESVCPQHLPVIKYLKDIVEHYNSIM